MVQAQETADQALARPARPAAPLRTRWALLAALAGGLLLAAAFPPVGAWPLAVAGPALLVLALSGRSLRASCCVGLVFGTAFYFPLLSWVTNVAWYAWLALALASTVIMGVLAIGQRLLLRLPGWPLAVAGWWVAAEAIRDRWPWGGFPWGRLAMSQAGTPAQGWAAIGGAPLLSFVVALVGAALAWLVLAAWPVRAPLGPGSRRRRVTRAATALAGSIVLAVLPVAITLDPVPAGAHTTEVAAIQGNVPRARTLAAQLNALTVTKNHADATATLARDVAAGRKPAPDLVIWPENSTDIDPTRYPPVYQEIASAAAAINRPILVGAVLQDPVRNASLLWLPGQGPTAAYVKQKLVPFGEYIPLRSLLSKVTSLTALQPQDFTPGTRNVVFSVGQIRLGSMICWEIGFDDLARSEVAAGANLLAMPSNDATYERDGETGETGQQLAMARIRAVEHDRAVVVASTTGYSAIIAPDGRLITTSGTWQQAELEARVPLVTYTTLADRVGAWPEYAIVALTAAALVVAAAGAAAGWSRRRRAVFPLAATADDKPE
ncbi:MAG TPA: apolipoprotein N-acyltransferase [Trebonia sp.]|nr:apolipoprotein N-acyltransferase [Trebonia sp.]